MICDTLFMSTKQNALIEVTTTNTDGSVETHTCVMPGLRIEGALAALVDAHTPVGFGRFQTLEMSGRLLKWSTK